MQRKLLVKLSSIVLICLVFVFTGASCSFFKTSITELKTSSSVDDATKKPVNTATVFTTDTKTIYISAKVSYGNKDTVVRAECWHTGANFKVADYSVPILGTRYVDFSLQKPQTADWPPGNYEVRAFLGDTQVATTTFEIKAK